MSVEIYPLHAHLFILTRVFSLQGQHSDPLKVSGIKKCGWNIRATKYTK